ncbi:MAG TPA: NusG domain II-containing protein [bacterium]|nr:NusG domain II-containing protein [bacterium]
MSTDAPAPTPGLLSRIRIKLLDVLILAVSIAALVALSVLVYGGAASETLVATADSGEWVYPLSVSRTVEIPGKLGVTVVAIDHGQARIIDSPCANKLCVSSPPIGKTGEWSACLPNGVFIRIEGAKKTDEIDAVVR